MLEDSPKTDTKNADIQEPPASPQLKPHKIVEMVRIQYEAPLPPPGMMAEYERILPGSANRIISMAESQASHRQSLESKKLNSDIINEKNGQVYAFALALILILGALLLTWQGKNLYGITLVIITLTSFITVFVYGRNSQARERREQMNKLLQALPKPHVKTSEREEPPDSF